MSLTYNGSGIVPAPFVQIDKIYNIEQSSHTLLSSEYDITLTGAIVESGNMMTDILAGQAYIKNTFGLNRKALVITDPSFNGSVTYYPDVLNISFDPGPWVKICRYTIKLRAPAPDDEQGGDKLLNRSESWSITEQPNGVKAIQHNVNAVGISTLGTSGYLNAKAWASTKKTTISSTGGIVWGQTDWTPGSGLVLSSLSATSGYWNYGYAENFNINENAWGFSENFIYYPTTSGYRAREEYTVQVQEDGSAFGQSLITVNGTVFGFGATETPESGTRLNNAKAYFDVIKPFLYQRAESYKTTGTVVNPSPMTKTATYDYTNGTINYGWAFRTGYGPLVSGAVEESLEINDEGQADVFASIPVPGRAAGPVIQYMYTRSSPKRTVTYNATFGSGILNNGLSGTNYSLLNLYNSRPDTDFMFTTLQPDNNVNFFIETNNIQWNPLRLNYSRTMSWVIDSSGYTGIPNQIHKVS